MTYVYTSKIGLDSTVQDTYGIKLHYSAKEYLILPDMDAAARPFDESSCVLTARLWALALLQRFK